MAESLFLTVRAATEYLGCTRAELISWVEPDRRLPGDVGPGSGARLWLRQTLDVAKPHVDVWRERDRHVAAAIGTKMTEERQAATARRKGMRKGGAILARAVCERLECSLTELNRWAADGRLPPDGEILLFGLPKKVNARAWLPDKVDAAKLLLDDWRTQDQAKKIFRRRGLRSIS